MFLKTTIPSTCSGSAVSLKIFIFLKTIISRNFSGSADRECIRPHSSALKARGEKTHGRFPLVAPLFPSASRRSSLPPKVGPAAGRRTKARPKRLNGLFLFARVYFGLLDGPDSALGRQKDATKTHIPSNTRVLLIVVPSPMRRIRPNAQTLKIKSSKYRSSEGRGRKRESARGKKQGFFPLAQ